MTTNFYKQVYDQPYWENIAADFPPINTNGNATYISCHDYNNTIYTYPGCCSIWPNPNNKYYNINKYDVRKNSFARFGDYLTRSSNDQNYVLSFDPTWGFTGNVLSADSTSITAGFPSTTNLVNYQIEIIDGMGKGQIRTITVMNKPTVHAKMRCTNGNTFGGFIDTSKNFQRNQYSSYNFHGLSGYFKGYHFNITWNDSTSITICKDAGFLYRPQDDFLNLMKSHQYTLPTTDVSVFQIESTKLILNSPWDIIPNNGSVFKILNTGAIQTLANGAGGPCTLDLLSKCMYNTMYFGGAYSANTDPNLVTIHSLYGAEDTGIASSGNYRTLIDTTKSWIINQWKNYRLKITNGDAIGENEQILSNDSTSITFICNINRQVTNNCQYKIYPDDDKIHFRLYAGYYWNIIGSKAAKCARVSKIYDYGYFCYNSKPNLRVNRTGSNTKYQTFLQNIGFNGNVAIAYLFNTGHNFKVGDLITVSGATGVDTQYYNGNFIVTSANDGGSFNYTMSGIPSADATCLSNTATTFYDITKNWIENEHVGRLFTIVSPDIGKTVMITSNTSNSITVDRDLSASYLSYNIHQYTILDPKFTGAIDTGSLNTSGYGIDTIADSDLITDTTKSWKTNQLVGHSVLGISNTNGLAVGDVVSNDATSITTTGLGATLQNYPYSVLSFNRYGGYGWGYVNDDMCWVSNSSNTLNKSRYIYMNNLCTQRGLWRFNISTEQYEFLNNTFQYAPGISTQNIMFKYDGGDYIYYKNPPGAGYNGTGFMRYNVLTNKIEEVCKRPPVATISSETYHTFEIVTINNRKYIYAFYDHVNIPGISGGNRLMIPLDN